MATGWAKYTLQNGSIRPGLHARDRAVGPSTDARPEVPWIPFPTCNGLSSPVTFTAIQQAWKAPYGSILIVPTTDGNLQTALLMVLQDQSAGRLPGIVSR